MGFRKICARCEGPINLPSSFFGLADCLLGAWRSFGERKIRREPEKRKNKLDSTFVLLKHFDDYASCLEHDQKGA